MMTKDDAQPDKAERIRCAMERVLKDPSFERAPVISCLLKYLVDRTLNGIPVKSYTIAIDALGKSGGELSDADTYARVAVARLRKALASYYARHPGEEEIYIDTGTYEVLLRDEIPTNEGSGTKPTSARAGWLEQLAHLRSSTLRYVAAGITILTLAVAYYWAEVEQGEGRWLHSDFPTVAIVLDDSEVDPLGPEDRDLDTFSNLLRAGLHDYVGLRLIDEGKLRADYEIAIDRDQLTNEKFVTVSLFETLTQRLVWTRQYSYSEEEQISRYAMLAATEIAALGGALNENGRRKQLSTNSPYGCWLQFTESITSYSSLVDEQLSSCAENWYAADSSNTVAAFLRNWAMVSDSTTMLSQSSSRAALEDALAVVHQALAHNPDSALLYVAEMRTYSFLGAREKMKQSGENALASAPHNRAIKGMVGSWFALWNDPEGAEILNELDYSPSIAMPWEHLGHLVVAIMQDDVWGAELHLRDLRIYMEGPPVLILLEAAYAGRSSGPEAAESELDRLRNHPRAWLAGPDEIMARLPVAPEVKARIEEWLSYQPDQAINN